MTIDIRVSRLGVEDIAVSADTIDETEQAHKLLGGVAGELRFLDLKLKSLSREESKE